MIGSAFGFESQLKVSIEGYRVTDVVTEYLEYFLRYCKSINIAVVKL